MNKDITHYARTRFSAKAFDPEKKIPQEKIAKIKVLLQSAASSTNSQPWHFVIASSEAAKAKIAKAADRLYSFNTQPILDASHVVIFCRRTDLDSSYLEGLIQKEEADGRFSDAPELKERINAGRARFVNMHRQEVKDLTEWMEKQIYLNLGSFLLGVATLGVDALAMEGIEFDVLDDELGLRDKGYASVMVVPIGYSDPIRDKNAMRPKSRLSDGVLFTEV